VWQGHLQGWIFTQIKYRHFQKDNGKEFTLENGIENIYILHIYHKKKLYLRKYIHLWALVKIRFSSLVRLEILCKRCPGENELICTIYIHYSMYFGSFSSGRLLSEPRFSQKSLWYKNLKFSNFLQSFWQVLLNLGSNHCWHFTVVSVQFLRCRCVQKRNLVNLETKPCSDYHSLLKLNKRLRMAETCFITFWK